MNDIDNTSITKQTNTNQELPSLFDEQMDGIEQEASALMEAAKACFTGGDLQGSANYLKSYLTLNNDDNKARARLVFILKQLKDFTAASQELSLMQEKMALTKSVASIGLNDYAAQDKYDDALVFLEQKLKKEPNNVQALVGYGDVLKTVGRKKEAELAFRQAIVIKPMLGAAFWGLANIKTYTFTEQEIKLMKSALVKAELKDKDRILLNYALGKALEDSGKYKSSFKHYTNANKIKARIEPYYKDDIDKLYANLKSTFTKEYFAEKGRTGLENCHPIFIVGLPRSGSTLTEQILASHSQIDGTRELDYIYRLSRNIYFNKKYGKGVDAKEKAKDELHIPYPVYTEFLSSFSRLELDIAGRYYDEKSNTHRNGAPLFTDKMPNNFMHIGLIHQILPNAKIIDVRRNPMSVGLSVYRQNFPKGLSFSNDFSHFSHFYQSYLGLMQHWDEVLPGKVHHLSYEELVHNPEQEIRKLLEYCELPFEENCLNFHQTKRAVKTPSAEQVRKPIYKDGIEQWKNYEQELEPLKIALGDVIDDYLYS